MAAATKTISRDQVASRASSGKTGNVGLPNSARESATNHTGGSIRTRRGQCPRTSTSDTANAVRKSDNSDTTATVRTYREARTNQRGGRTAWNTPAMAIKKRKVKALAAAMASTCVAVKRT